MCEQINAPRISVQGIVTEKEKNRLNLMNLKFILQIVNRFKHL